MATSKVHVFDLFKKESSNLLWDDLSQSENVRWHQSMIEKYAACINWDLLSGNTSVLWTKELIMKFEDEWNWFALSEMVANMLPYNDFRHILAIYPEKLNWSIVCQGVNINPHMVRNYSRYIDWTALSANALFPWSEKRIVQYRSKINWSVFSGTLSKKLLLNEENMNAAKFKRPKKDETEPQWYLDERTEYNSFRDSFLKKYEHRWDWDILSENDQIYIGDSLIRIFRDKWNWEALINNSAINWTENMITEFRSYIPEMEKERLYETHLWKSLKQHNTLSFLFLLPTFILEQYKEDFSEISVLKTECHLN